MVFSFYLFIFQYLLGSMKWSCLDKLTLAIFIQEVVLAVISLFLNLYLEGLLNYVILFQIGKAATIGICLFAAREKACSRLTAAIIFAVVLTLDVIYFLFWFMIIGAILSVGCADPPPDAKEGCETFGGIFFLWIIGCVVFWLIHLS